mmetsp:Transcript_35858/g.77526  ORF Transcript_35858/g.77526 Transcript_35858/m.77526 type:complete len:96 (+) Transcript_35858:817-1104(+)
MSGHEEKKQAELEAVFIRVEAAIAPPASMLAEVGEPSTQDWRDIGGEVQGRVPVASVVDEGLEEQRPKDTAAAVECSEGQQHGNVEVGDEVTEAM